MQSDTLSRRTKHKSNWHKVKRVSGLYQYLPSGVYHARVRHGGKLYRESLNIKDLALAKRKLRDFKDRLERTDPRLGKVTLVAWLEKIYAPTLRGAPGAIKAKKRIITKIKRTWFDARKPMRELKDSQIVTWLNKQYGDHSESYWNSALSVIRDALDMAVRDHVIMDNPAAGLKYRKRKNPIRLTPTFDQFKAIVADIRAQPFNREAEDSGDLVEFLGLAGLGQAEAASIIRDHVRLDAGQIDVYRHKTARNSPSRSIHNCARWWRNSAKAKNTTSVCFRSTKRVRRSPMRAGGWNSRSTRTDHFAGCSSPAQSKRARM